MNIEKIKQQFPEWNKPSRSNLKDLTGQRFGRLLVLYRYCENTSNNGSQWVCQCDCGNIKVIRGGSLTKKTKPTRSCGCQTYENASKANKNDLTGQRFGRLVVLYDTNKRKHGHVVWMCRCDCGREIERVSDSLIQKDTFSCGCCNRSIGSITIEKILKENKIQYELEKTFKDLKGKNNMPYRFDFYLPEYNRLIEFDGIQHYKKRDIFKDSLETIQKRDKIKNEYCIQHNIPLVRIPYWKIDTLKIEDLLNTKYEVEL